MELDEQLMAIEQKLWGNDAVFYKRNLIEESLLVFPETGVITRDVAVEAILAEQAEGEDGLRYERLLASCEALVQGLP